MRWQLVGSWATPWHQPSQRPSWSHLSASRQRWLLPEACDWQRQPAEPQLCVDGRAAGRGITLCQAGTARHLRVERHALEVFMQHITDAVDGICNCYLQTFSLAACRVSTVVSCSMHNACRHPNPCNTTDYVEPKWESWQKTACVHGFHRGSRCDDVCLSVICSMRLDR